MIEIVIKIKDGKIMDSLEDENCTLCEASVVLYRLEQIKLLLLSKEFKDDFVYREGGEDLEDETKEM